jgi:hypothetical protein
VLGSTVITEGGRNLGIVTDVILSVGDRTTDAVGYEIDPADDSAPRRQFVPLPDTLSVSGEALMLPESAVNFIRDDLAGFGAAVDEFRRQLRKEAADGEASGQAAPPAQVAPPAQPAPPAQVTPPAQPAPPAQVTPPAQSRDESP